MRHFLISLVGAALSFAYWWLVATVGFGLTGGSIAPDAPPPSEQQLMLTSAVVIAMAILLYAGLTVLWNRTLLKMR
ncbi:MAG: hypothetical protein PGN21_15175 [Sphingomonas paucimobilis]